MIAALHLVSMSIQRWFLLRSVSGMTTSRMPGYLLVHLFNPHRTLSRICRFAGVYPCASR
eukprot:6195459-Pleurochrysis_carterae.AAC.1